MPPHEGLTLLESSGEAGTYRIRLRLEPDSPVLAGHFPGHPILPGIAHLGLALDAARALEERALTLAALRGVRFRRPVRPGDVVDLVVARGAAPGDVRFELRSAEEVASSGTLIVTMAPGTDVQP
jgi:3-hydroxymyristoyl/3-hydroxydecanoyl-(acyl carrier protein) dehydratase